MKLFPDKEEARRLVGEIPGLFKEMAGAIKKQFDSNGQELLEGANGVVGLTVRFFGRKYIDHYFTGLKNQRLAGFGSGVYLEAAMTQAHKSLEKILKQGAATGVADTVMVNTLLESLQAFADQLTQEAPQLYMLFQPTAHPAVVTVRRSVQRLLQDGGAQQQAVDDFLKDFNLAIEDTIRLEFGDHYTDHQKAIENHWLDEKEAKFLQKMAELDHIGLQEGEKLAYEETFGCWLEVDSLGRWGGGQTEELLTYYYQERMTQDEQELLTVQNLLADYFQDGDSDNNLTKILFIVSDFGKGKSVFMRRMAAESARNYLRTGDGLFPIYFNLRDYGSAHYHQDDPLGIVASFLKVDHALDPSSDRFKKKTLLLLVDSLDESGDLSRRATHDVVANIYKFQKLDEMHCRRNRLIIASRPMDEGFKELLTSYHPHTRKDEENRDISQFISLYGFKKEQFNHWLISSLLQHPDLNLAHATVFVQKVWQGLQNKEEIDIYDLLESDKILSTDELRRPIFAYMLYRLIISRNDFTSAGRIGIYLSFLNLLTREAKHRDDPLTRQHTVKPAEEFRYRNILHAVAALWQHRRGKGEQGTLPKGEIYAAIARKEVDPQTIEQKFKEVDELRFLSHSYFGQDEDRLHFQHQSFAEILLAEYYLKVFLKFALDDDHDGEESARLHLLLGEPTTQTIHFYEELLLLLKKSVADEDQTRLATNRRMLLPLLASLATKEYDRGLHSSFVFYNWYKPSMLGDAREISDERHLANWPVTEETIEKIVVLAVKILNSQREYLPLKGKPATTLFGDDAIFLSQAPYSIPPDIDRWLALLTGNILDTDITKERFFNRRLEKAIRLFDLVKNRNRYDKRSMPPWVNTIQYKYCHLFAGGIYLGEGIDLSYLNFTFINFLHSKFNDIKFENSNLSRCKFNKSIFGNVSFANSSLNLSSFHNVEIKDGCDFTGATIIDTFRMPLKLNYFVNGGFPSEYYEDYINHSHKGFDDDHTLNISEYIASTAYSTLYGILCFLLQNRNVTLSEMKSWFIFFNKGSDIYEILIKNIDSLQHLERPEEERAKDWPPPELKIKLDKLTAPML